jgi:hypothetical protein
MLKLADPRKIELQLCWFEKEKTAGFTDKTALFTKWYAVFCSDCIVFTRKIGWMSNNFASFEICELVFSVDVIESMFIYKKKLVTNSKNSFQDICLFVLKFKSCLKKR